jgi:hypothetical protein
MLGARPGSIGAALDICRGHAAMADSAASLKYSIEWWLNLLAEGWALLRPRNLINCCSPKSSICIVGHISAPYVDDR